MANNYFAFKQFTVYQDKCAMKVSTDGVLLGAWTNTEGMRLILDVGTGTGLIALMLAQRSISIIDAVDIDRNAAAQALQNVKDSPWAERINVYHKSLQAFAERLKPKYNLIVSNPPYYQQALRSPDKARTLARHDVSLNYQSLLFYAGRILLPDGIISTIMPADSTEVFIHQACIHGFYPQRMAEVRTIASAKPSRVMIELTRTMQHEPAISALTIMQHDARTYTAEYKKMTAEYYL